MKIRTLIKWLIVLALIDSAIKIIINQYFLDVRFDIIPNLFEFRPKFNDHYSYVNHLFGLGMGFWTHVVIFCFLPVILLVLYDMFSVIPNDLKLFDTAFVFCLAGYICGVIGLVTGGCLDYIYLKPLFIFDLKDLYMNCFEVLLFIFLIKNRKSLKSVKTKKLPEHFRSIFKKVKED